ncbi:MAG: hypothetical protein ACTTKL_03145 [Treponema sp.]
MKKIVLLHSSAAKLCDCLGQRHCCFFFAACLTNGTDVGFLLNFLHFLSERRFKGRKTPRFGGMRKVRAEKERRRLKIRRVLSGNAVYLS